MVGGYPYDFTRGDDYIVLVRRTKQGRMCSGSEPCSRFGALDRDDGARMADATEIVKRETDCTVFEEPRRWNRAVKSRGKSVEERPADGVLFDRDNISAGVGQMNLVVVIENSVDPSFELAAVALLASIRSVAGDWRHRESMLYGWWRCSSRGGMS